MKAIINGNTILEDKIVENGTILFSEKIEEIITDGSVPENAEIIDAKGGYVAPGLIDLHIHGYLGKDVCDGDEESIRTISKGLLANGVTGYLPTTMTVGMETITKALEVYRKLKEKSKDWDGSAILGCHAEGPFVSYAKKGAQNPDYILKPDADFVCKYADVIKIITLAPEEDDGFKAIKEIAKNTDVLISIGHTSATYKQAMEAIEAGASHVTHLFNAMSPLSHREPGVVGAALNSDATCELIVDTYHVSPALYDMLWKVKGRKLCFITDCLPAGGLTEGEHTLGEQKIIYHGDVCRLEDGTIAGSVLPLNKGVWNVYTNSSIPLWECVNGASLNPATAIGMEKNKGSIEAGKDADIIITDNEFNVRKTIIGGKIKYDIC